MTASMSGMTWPHVSVSQ